MKKAELRMNTGNTGTQNSHAALGRESKSALVVVAEPQPTEDPSCHEALDPEVCDRATRRRFTAEYKRSILAQADGCRNEGAIGALLRREGLYSSHLTTWRRQREEGTLAALSQKRGRKSTLHPLTEENARLKVENECLARRLEQAEIIIEVQKKVSTLFGMAPAETKPNGKHS